MTLILSGTDGLSDIDGSAATPAIRGTDANTGIFFPAADTIAFSEGGVEAMRIDSSGNVGIGSTPSTKLDVNGPSGNTSFTGTNAMAITVRGSTSTTDYSAIDFRSSAANSGSTAIGRIGVVAGGAGSSMSFGTSNSYASGITNTAMTIDPSGNVGIGTSSPAFPLDVAGAARSNSWIGRANGSAPTADAAIYRAADNTLAFSTANTERARIDSSGNLRLVNSNNIASITQTAITLTGAGGSGTGGQTVNVITANSTTRGILIVGSTQNCSAIFFINASNAVNLSSQTTNETRFSATSGAANTANVYVSGSNIVLQNNIQATRDFYVTFIGQV